MGIKRKTKAAVALLRRSPAIVADILACTRYRVSRNALPFTEQTLKKLPAKPPKRGPNAGSFRTL